MVYYFNFLYFSFFLDVPKIKIENMQKGCIYALIENRYWGYPKDLRKEQDLLYVPVFMTMLL